MIQRLTAGLAQWFGLASSTTCSVSFTDTNLNGPEPMGSGSMMLSAVSGLSFRLSKIGAQMCFGARFSLDNELTRNAASGRLRVIRRLIGPVASTLAILATKGRYIGDLSPKPGACRLNTASSMVTGWPSCHIMPGRSVTSTVVGVGRVTDSAAQGRGRPSGPIRISRSHTSSVAHDPWMPGMLNGLRLVGGATEFSTTSRCAPRGFRPIQVQKLRMPMPACCTVLPSSQTVLLKATRFLGCTRKA